MKRATAAEESVLRRVQDRRVSAAELVDGLAGEGYSKDEAVRAILALEGDKKVVVSEPEPYATLASYAFSPISFWFWAAVAAVFVSVVLVSVTSGAALYLRYAFGSALVLFLPGYSLIEALYPKRELDELTRFALSVGLSLALVPLAGLVLNYTPFGIRLIPVTSTIAGLTVALLLLALFRKHQYYKLAKGVVV